MKLDSECEIHSGSRTSISLPVCSATGTVAFGVANPGSGLSWQRLSKEWAVRLGGYEYEYVTCLVDGRLGYDLASPLRAAVTVTIYTE